MRTSALQYILGFLVLLRTAHGNITPTVECTTKAWVRAPDLAPNTIVQGDARVKISAECPTIEYVSLGLRFKERSFVKALRSREDVKWLNPEPPKYDFLDTSLWASVPSRFANKSVEEAYEEIITNKDLWTVREEERVVFETTQPFDMASGDHGSRRDAVHDFSILIPSTNFPPALDFIGPLFPAPFAGEILDVQWIYEYFARISFTNGTTKEISAGFTTFQPQYDPAHISQGLTSASVGLKPSSVMKENLANYSIDIRADSGLMFFTGTKGHIITAVVTRTGFARTFSAPLEVLACITPGSSPKWAAEYNMSDTSLGLHYQPTFVLRATSDNNKPAFPMWSPRCFRHRGPVATVIMPNSTLDEIQANEIVTTTSEAFTISVDVDNAHIPTFETYYQTLVNSLTINLETPRAEGEDIDPDDPSGEPDFRRGQLFEDDEEAWVPWENRNGMPRAKIWRLYSGSVPAVVHPREGTPSPHCLHSSIDTSGQAVLSDETGCEQHSFIHYLDEGARGPIFVDRNVVHELLAEDPAKRELYAPILRPAVSSPLEGEEVPYRYYHPRGGNKPHMYVGKTWAKKVADKDHY